MKKQLCAVMKALITQKLSNLKKKSRIFTKSLLCSLSALMTLYSIKKQLAPLLVT